MIYQLVKGISKIATYSEKVLPDITVFHFKIVNACVIGDASGWVLVDTGLENSYEFILEKTGEIFGEGRRPTAILLTHGHFDHIGCIKRLLEKWEVPVYAHEEEIPYLTGRRNYPKPDPTVDEGMVAKMSPAFPNEGIDISSHIRAFPSEGRIPGLKDWEWIHTPGHTVGHVSFFRGRDKLLIAGDAFTTRKQESFLSVLTEKEKFKGPPAYLTEDWEKAKASVVKLKNLGPELVIPSHGAVIQGEELRKQLELLAEHFNQTAVPEKDKV